MSTAIESARGILANLKGVDRGGLTEKFYQRYA
jgi:hypothetical protein